MYFYTTDFVEIQLQSVRVSMCVNLYQFIVDSEEFLQEFVSQFLHFALWLHLIQRQCPLNYGNRLHSSNTVFETIILIIALHLSSV